jgi:hypothetical protein
MHRGDERVCEMSTGPTRRVAGILVTAGVVLASGAGAASAAWTEVEPLSDFGPTAGVDVDRRGVAHLDHYESIAGDDPMTLRVDTRQPGGPWVRSAEQPADLPLDAEGVRGRGVARGSEGQVLAWRIDAAGELGVALGRDGVFSPAVRLAGPVAGMRAWAAVNPRGEAVVVWRAQGPLMAAISDARGRFGPAAVIASRFSSLRGPDIAFNEAGDITVAWATNNAVRAAVRRADAGWRPSMKVSRGSAGVRGLSLAMDARGHAILLWPAAAPAVVRGGANYASALMSAEHRPGAARWSEPVRLARGVLTGPHTVGMDAAGGALIVWGQPLGLGARYLERAPGGAWQNRGRLPGATCCLAGLTVGPLGDAAIASGPPTSAIGIVHRRSGSRTWRQAPQAIGSGAFSGVELAANAAGDFAVAWNSAPSNSSYPLYAAAYDAPAPAGVRRVTPRPARAGTASGLRLAVDASAAGRILVTVRRAGQRRVQAAFITSVRAGRNAVRLPARAARAIGRGRYVVEVESGSRPIAARPSAEVTVLGR